MGKIEKKWPSPHIEAKNITDNVVELMTRKLERLPAAIQTSLQSAACIGNRFDVATLAIITEKSVAEIEADLQMAWREDVILPLNEPQLAVEAWTPEAGIKPPTILETSFLGGPPRPGEDEPRGSVAGIL